MGLKSRGNWATGVCLRKCANRGRRCNYCFGFSKFEPIKEEEKESQGNGDSQDRRADRG